MPADAPLGPVMLDLAGLSLDAADREVLTHPAVGGVILFKRNFASTSQLDQLTADIRALRSPPLLIAVDHEGGRVQRFQEGFTRLPPMRALGKVYERDPALAENLAGAVGIVLASELFLHGVDLTFAPVVDIDFGASDVIGDRAFHDTPQGVARLAASLVRGMGRIGMGAVAKHFPGHGFVRADSHVAVPVDNRELAEIEANDLLPYRTLIAADLAGVMPAHVIYSKVDSRPAGFSSVWLQRILRGKLGFDGLVFSDDLSMEGASVAGDITERSRAALAAGCDMVLVCGNREAACALVAGTTAPPLATSRLARFRGMRSADGGAGYDAALRALSGAGDSGLLA
jgi:beta-N-acetylhexosaminidase